MGHTVTVDAKDNPHTLEGGYSVSGMAVENSGPMIGPQRRKKGFLLSIPVEILL